MHLLSCQLAVDKVIQKFALFAESAKALDQSQRLLIIGIHDARANQIKDPQS